MDQTLQLITSYVSITWTIVIQLLSEVPHLQSKTPSQRNLSGMQLLLSAHGLYPIGQTVVQLASSLPSSQLGSIVVKNISSVRSQKTDIRYFMRGRQNKTFRIVILSSAHPHRFWLEACATSNNSLVRFICRPPICGFSYLHHIGTSYPGIGRRKKTLWVHREYRTFAGFHRCRQRSLPLRRTPIFEKCTASCYTGNASPDHTSPARLRTFPLCSSESLVR